MAKINEADDPSVIDGTGQPGWSDLGDGLLGCPHVYGAPPVERMKEGKYVCLGLEVGRPG